MVVMAQPSYAPVFVPVSVIGPQFILPYQLEIIVDTYSSGNLVITDTNHKIMLKVKPYSTSFHRQLLLLDAVDRPIVMLREKNMSGHDGWNVFRGDSKADSDMIFSTKTPHMIQFKTKVNVFMANKMSSKNGCDFNIKGSWSKRECTVYMGDSSTTIAQMHEMQPMDNVKFSEDKFMVTIYPNVDYAFVVTLIAIVYAMKSSDTKDVVAGQVVGGVAQDVVSAVIS
ncbi:protein LURP-one-related 10-like [Cynara cardunculus var. scolymus]|uniref:protein LURP-one-related 10-like n=1 Tax=Cynara cardunculus var. scolymus TaxID=59895 RepID=UPI000D629396|nr:protein LURP-one-related 10-like [Cynara cardunculus var. scolymus]